MAIEKVEYQGIPVTLDRPRGFVQEGRDENGNPWKRLYRFDYGFIPKTEGGDGEDVDVFLGPNPNAPTSWWAVQTKSDGSFDEFKVFMGFSTFALAKGCYNIHIPPRFCAGFFAIPVNAIKSILGLEPGAVIEGLRKRMRIRTTKLEGVSFETLSSLLCDALRLAYPSGEDGACAPCGPYPIEVYDDAVVFSHDGKLFKQGYAFANGAVTLAGSPIQVMRTYVPVDAAGTAGETTMNQKQKMSGAGDIVTLATERLSAVAGELKDPEASITPPQKEEIGAVIALLEIAMERYAGSAPEGGPEEDAIDGGADDALEMAADVDDAEKRGGTVMMTPESVVTYVTEKIAAARKIADPVLRTMKTTRLESMLLNALSAAKSDLSEDGRIPVVIVAEEASAAKTETGDDAPTNGDVVGQPNAPSEPSNATPPAPGTPAEKSAGARLTQSVKAMREKFANAIGVKKNDGAPAAPPAASSQTGAELFTEDYVAALPDSAFLFVDPEAQKDDSGKTEKMGRHFPVYDANGIASVAMIAQAMKSIPMWPAQSAVRAEVMKRATDLQSMMASVMKSVRDAPLRGDVNWPDDMGRPLNGKKPGPPVFGYDDLPGKLATTAE